MISIHLQKVDSAEAWSNENTHWVTLRSGEDRLTIHTLTHQQAVAIADAINSELEARS